MAYNNSITTSGVASLIPQETASEIIKNVIATNPIMQLAKKLPNMSSSQTKMSVASALASAYFVNGSAGLKQTSSMSWENKYLDAEEIAVIVPIAQDKLDDSSYDIWGEVRPSIEEAITLLITQAVLYGTNIPSSWTTNLGAAGLVAVCTAASQTLSLADYDDVYGALLGKTGAGALGVLGAVEADGFGVTGSLAHMSFKSELRNCRTTDGHPVFNADPNGPTPYSLDGSPVYFPTDGSIVSGSSLLVAGDWQKLVYSMRQEMTYTIADQAVITDAAGAIVYNLFQQDMVALRATMRLGFALPNPINRMEETAASRCPFATLTA